MIIVLAREFGRMFTQVNGSYVVLKFFVYILGTVTLKQPLLDQIKNETVMWLITYTLYFNFLFKISVKIANKMNDNKWTNNIRIHSSLNNHNNIVRFIGFKYTKRFMAILMESIDMNLKDLLTMQIASDRQTLFNHFIKLTLDVINGMVRILYYFYTYLLKMYIIENEIIHRNLKADNILISAGGTAKVDDIIFAQFQCKFNV